MSLQYHLHLEAADLVGNDGLGRVVSAGGECGAVSR